MIHRVCVITRELDGIAGAGGLKDAVRGLCKALVHRGIEVTVILPRYGFVEPGHALDSFTVNLHNSHYRVNVTARRFDGMDVVLLDAPMFSNKSDIYTYHEEDAVQEEFIGRGHRDAHRMNILHQAASIRFLLRRSVAPDLIHGHDGHSGLLPLYMRKYDENRFFRNTGVLITIHNAGWAYQQNLGDVAEAAAETGLDPQLLARGRFKGLVSPLLIAGVYGHINTVSPGYSRELRKGRVRHDEGLGAEYRRRGIALKGLYNGIDPHPWNRDRSSPRVDDVQAKEHLRNQVVGRLTGMEELRIYGGLPETGKPWFLFHSRITRQKGLDEILALPSRFAQIPLIVYGRGDTDIESQLIKRVEEYSGWTFIRGYDRKLTSALLGASSYFLAPSAWEPCGQIDMAAQLFGALPIVRGVGGLKKIRDRIDGFRYSAGAEDGLARKMVLALKWEEQRPGKVSRMRRRAENTVYGKRSWRKVLVRGYLPLYRKSRRHIRHYRS